MLSDLYSAFFHSTQPDIRVRDIVHAGDVNGDGINDLLISAAYPSGNETYVLFGQQDGFETLIDIAQLDPTKGYVIRGSTDDLSYRQHDLASADINGDGINDILIGEAVSIKSQIGKFHIVFGQSKAPAEPLELDDLPQLQGATYEISNIRGFLNRDVVSLGDINDDGFDDFAITQDSGFFRPGNTDGYIVFGANDLTDLDFSDVTAADGRRIENARDTEPLFAGDFNADGTADVAFADAENERVTVLFDVQNDGEVAINLFEVDGTNGIVLSAGEVRNAWFGRSAASLGDVNGDGIDDIGVGAIVWDHQRVDRTGAAFVFYGSEDWTDSEISVADLDGTNGFAMYGTQAGEYLGTTVSSVGDINQDGLDDFAVSANSADLNGFSYVGKVHIVFGTNEPRGPEFDLTTLDGSNGYTILGAREWDRLDIAPASGGDLSGDGVPDLLLRSNFTASTMLLHGGATLAELDALDGTQDGSINIDFLSAVTGTDAAERINGTGLSERLDGLGGNDVLHGYGGGDILDGGVGADLMIGGPGSDILYVDDAADSVGESRNWLGRDVVIASIDFALGRQHVEDLRLTGDAKNGIGNGLRNVIYGNDQDNLLDGGRNVDVLIGGSGDDTYLVRSPGDTVGEKQDEGEDTVLGFRSVLLDDHVENLFLQDVFNKAGEGINGLNGLGNASDNVIVGNAFDNTIAGRLGSDILEGGLGSDRFVFDREFVSKIAGESDIDTIRDFSTGNDHLLLKSQVFPGIERGTLAATSFVLGTSAADTDDRILYDPASGALFFDPDGTGKAEAQTFAILEDRASIEASDIFVF